MARTLEERLQSEPDRVRRLALTHPVSVENYLDAKNLPPLAPGHEPRLLEIYYGDDAPAAIVYQKGWKTERDLSVAVGDGACRVWVDDYWAYISVDDRVLLDRGIARMKLPDDILDPRGEIQILLRELRRDFATATR